MIIRYLSNINVYMFIPLRRTEVFPAIEKLYERGVSEYLVSSVSYCANWMNFLYASLCMLESKAVLRHIPLG